MPLQGILKGNTTLVGDPGFRPSKPFRLTKQISEYVYRDQRASIYIASDDRDCAVALPYPLRNIERINRSRNKPSICNERIESSLRDNHRMTLLEIDRTNLRFDITKVIMTSRKGFLTFVPVVISRHCSSKISSSFQTLYESRTINNRYKNFSDMTRRTSSSARKVKVPCHLPEQ